MKLHFLITAAAALLVAFPLRVSECRALDGPDRRPSLSSHYANALDEGEDQMREHPFWARLGEEYFIRLGSRNEREGESVPETRPEPASAVFKRALQLRLTRHLLRGHEDEVAEAARGLREVPAERPRRAEEPPISLDLTFHLLREVLEMAKAEQLAQQAHSNRKMMEIFGK